MTTTVLEAGSAYYNLNWGGIGNHGILGHNEPIQMNTHSTLRHTTYIHMQYMKTN